MGGTACALVTDLCVKWNVSDGGDGVRRAGRGGGAAVGLRVAVVACGRSLLPNYCLW